jgi:hypothetical protein
MKDIDFESYADPCPIAILVKFRKGRLPMVFNFFKSEYRKLPQMRQKARTSEALAQDYDENLQINRLWEARFYLCTPHALYASFLLF